MMGWVKKIFRKDPLWDVVFEKDEYGEDAGEEDEGMPIEDIEHANLIIAGFNNGVWHFRYNKHEYEFPELCDAVISANVMGVDVFIYAGKEERFFRLRVKEH
jgi:hypothetical protein